MFSHKFKPGDAERYTTLAKTDPARRLWSFVANSVSRKGGTEVDAIRIANGSVLKHFRNILANPPKRVPHFRSKYVAQQGLFGKVVGLVADLLRWELDHETPLCLGGHPTEGVRWMSRRKHKEKTNRDVTNWRFIKAEIPKRTRR
jgi:hypothetical protein